MHDAATSIHLVVIGASWGGVEACSQLLSGLPASFPAAVALVQHQRMDNSSRLAKVLQRQTAMAVQVPDNMQPIEAGQVYVSPPGYHLLVAEGGIFNYSLSAPVHFCRPAIDELFYSAAHVYGQQLAGVLLTGANEDGAAGLRYIKQRGGLTLVQSPATAAAPTMPQSAIDLGAAMEVLTIKEITHFLMEKVAGKTE